jgi:hypothetical protein
MRMSDALDIVYDLAEDNALPYSRDSWMNELDQELYEESERQSQALHKVRELIEKIRREEQCGQSPQISK